MPISPLERQKAGTIAIADIASGTLAEINKLITSIRVSYTLNMASELQFTVIDPDLLMMSKNYFQVGRTVIYTSPTIGLIDDFISGQSAQRVVSNIQQLFEISRIDLSEGPGNSAQVRVTCYSRAVQQMRRDKKPQSINGDGTAYARRAALKYGLRFAGEKTTKKKTINKASGDKQSESLWQVLERIATDAKFVLYEVNGVLVFASQKYLLNKWGTFNLTTTTWDKKAKRFKPKVERYIPIIYPSIPTVNEQGKVVVPDFHVIGTPSLEYSENDSYDGRGSLNLARDNATQLRPGMTIDIQGIPQFSGRYLIESVSFDDLSPDPVAITFRKPEREDKEKEKRRLSVGVRTRQTNEFLRKDPFQTGDFGLRSNKTKKFIPEIARLLGITTPIDETSKAVANLYPLPKPKNELLYPRVPKVIADDVLAYGNIGLWSRPLYRDEVGIYPLDIQIVEISEPSTWAGGNIFVLLPGVYVDEEGLPARVGSSAEALARYELDGLFLAKLKTNPAALMLKNALDQQQIFILAERFPRSPLTSGVSDIVEHSLYPLPSDAEEQNYPYIGDGLIESGNIDLYSAPILNFKNSGKQYIETLGVVIRDNVVESGFNDDAPFALLLQTIVSSGGSVVRMSDEVAYRKYKTDGLFLGKCTSYSAALQYGRLLQQQQLLLMNERASTSRYLDRWYTNG